MVLHNKINEGMFVKVAPYKGSCGSQSPDKLYVENAVTVLFP
jgi:hypothetical protein